MILLALVIAFIIWMIGWYMWWYTGFETLELSIIISICMFFIITFGISANIDNEYPNSETYVEWFPFLGVFNYDLPDGTYYKFLTMVSIVKYDGIPMNVKEFKLDKVPMTTKDGLTGYMHIGYVSFRIEKTHKNLENLMFKHNYYQRIIAKEIPLICEEYARYHTSEQLYAMSLEGNLQRKFNNDLFDRLLTTGLRPIIHSDGEISNYMSIFYFPPKDQLYELRDKYDVIQ